MLVKKNQLRRSQSQTKARRKAPANRKCQHLLEIAKLSYPRRKREETDLRAARSSKMDQGDRTQDVRRSLTTWRETGPAREAENLCVEDEERRLDTDVDVAEAEEDVSTEARITKATTDPMTSRQRDVRWAATIVN